MRMHRYWQIGECIGSRVGRTGFSFLPDSFDLSLPFHRFCSFYERRWLGEAAVALQRVLDTLLPVLPSGLESNALAFAIRHSQFDIGIRNLALAFEIWHWHSNECTILSGIRDNLG